MSDSLLEQAHRGDPAAKEQLIRENAPLIWSIVKRFMGRGVDADDLYQLGCVGFLKAMEGYDASFGTRFSTYAVPKIAGEMRRFLRDDGSVKVSRTLKEQAVRIRTARGALAQKLGREPRISELALELDMRPQEIAQAETAALPTDSLQRPAGEDGCALEQLLPGEEIEERILDHVSLRDALESLEKRQQAVIDLRYFHGLTQAQTASILGVSQVQVSRIERKSLLRLREAISEE